jgi:hypothetical protein
MRRADRLFQIIQILRRSTRPVTATQLAEELEVSKRSVYRDVADLMGRRVPIRGEAGLGYVLDRDFDMPPLMLTSDEIEAAVLGAQWVADKGDAVLAGAARDLIAKIAMAVPERLRPFIAEPSVGAPPSHAMAPDGLDIARTRLWIRSGRKIRIRYRDEHSRKTSVRSGRRSSAMPRPCGSWPPGASYVGSFGTSGRTASSPPDSLRSGTAAGPANCGPDGSAIWRPSAAYACHSCRARREIRVTRGTLHKLPGAECRMPEYSRFAFVPHHCRSRPTAHGQDRPFKVNLTAGKRTF